MRRNTWSRVSEAGVRGASASRQVWAGVRHGPTAATAAAAAAAAVAASEGQSVAGNVQERTPSPLTLVAKIANFARNY